MPGRCRATTLEVAITVMRPTPEATFSEAERDVEERHEEHAAAEPEHEPRPPAAAPATITSATIEPEISGNDAETSR